MMDRPFSPAAERNREPILAVLQQVLPPSGRILEIGSGTAQHVQYFADRLKQWTWQPSEISDNLAALKRVLSEPSAATNLLVPILLDVAGCWPEQKYEAVYSANTAHIMSWFEVQAMFAGIANVLAVNGVFVLYGPFKMVGRPFADSNRQFDQSLRQRNPVMGIRELEALDTLADSVQLQRTAEFAMPANNHILMFEKER